LWRHSDINYNMKFTIVVPLAMRIMSALMLVILYWPVYFVIPKSLKHLPKLFRPTVQLRYMRTTHTRIIRAYFAYTRMLIRAHIRIYTRTYARICLFVMHSHKFLYVKQCLSNKEHYISGNEKGFKAKFACCWNVLPINEGYHILSFRSLRKFTDKLLFINTCLILSYQKWEENWNSRLNSLF